MAEIHSSSFTAETLYTYSNELVSTSNTNEGSIDYQTDAIGSIRASSSFDASKVHNYDSFGDMICDVTLSASTIADSTSRVPQFGFTGAYREPQL